MKIERFGLDKKGLYSEVTLANGELFPSAQTGYNRQGVFVGEGDVVRQTQQACQNILDILAERGTDVTAVCKVSIYVPEQKDCVKTMEIAAQYFQKAQPAISCICVDLEEEKLLVKVDVEAFVG